MFKVGDLVIFSGLAGQPVKAEIKAIGMENDSGHWDYECETLRTRIRFGANSDKLKQYK